MSVIRSLDWVINNNVFALCIFLLKFSFFSFSLFFFFFFTFARSSGHLQMGPVTHFLLKQLLSLFNKHLLRAYYVPGTFPGMGYKGKQGRHSCASMILT